MTLRVRLAVMAPLAVREHLVIGGRRENETWTLDRIFDLFRPLLQRLYRRAANLSIGEQSMLAVARTLRTEPRCLILDEPTEGLARVHATGKGSIVFTGTKERPAIREDIHEQHIGVG